jgi:hypothetical protein
MLTRVLAFTMILSGIVVAQTTIPGTFNRTQQQTPGTANNGGSIVSTPTISLGNGITPTVITNQDTVNVTLPQNTSLSGPTVQANAPAPVSTDMSGANAANAVGTDNGQNVPGQASRNFDFVKAPGGETGPVVGSMEDPSISLGEVARKVRNGKQISKRTITNADVNAMNGSFPGSGDQSAQDANGSTATSMASPGSQQNASETAGASTQTTGGTAGAAQPQNSQAPAYAQPSNRDPFNAPSATPNDGTKPNAQQGPGVTPRSSSRRVQTPSDNSNGSNNTEKRHLPESSSSLPLLATFGALSTVVGIGYLKLR